jgi:alpha-1,3-rhamnosyl/mannosyltransferase
MKILFNCLSVAYPISGVGEYTLQLGKALEALLGDRMVFWFGKNLPGYRHVDFDSPIPTFANRVQYHLGGGLRKIPGLTIMLHLWRDRKFRSYTRRVKPSLYHETRYALFRFDDGPTVITVYDLSFVRHPEWHPADRAEYLERYFLKRISNVDAVITISEFSKKEITSLLGIRPDKIYVTPLGADRTFSPGKKEVKGLPNEYILSLGNLEPRKNLVTLLDAYRSLPKKLRERFPLVIAGASGWHTEALKKALQLFPGREKPILTGYVPKKLLPDLYRGASLFVYPSLYEGFGLPVIEAMACGVPVLASNAASLPEVVGDAGVLVGPRDVNHLKEAMKELLEDEKARRALAEKGIARAKLFSWDKCARQTLSVYERSLGMRE